MADGGSDLDVEAMLDLPLERKGRSQRSESSSPSGPSNKSVSQSPDKKTPDRSPSKRKVTPSRSRSSSPSRSRDRKRKRKSRSRSSDRHRSSHRKHHRSSRRKRSRSRDRKHKRRSRDRSSSRRRSKSVSPSSRSSRRHYRSRTRSPRRTDLTVEERDERTVYCVQLHPDVTKRDLLEFFSEAGKVREVRYIMDNKTRKHKGIAYIEFNDLVSVPLAMKLNGNKLRGRPVMVNPSQAEKNRMQPTNIPANQQLRPGFTSGGGPNTIPNPYFQNNYHGNRFARSNSVNPGAMKLYVGSLHFNITEDMLETIFKPFGKLDKVELMRNEDGKSKGYAFVTFNDQESGNKALAQLHGFNVAGRAMRVSPVLSKEQLASSNGGTSSASSSHQQHAHSYFDTDDQDRHGFDNMTGNNGRLHLMAKLAEGTGVKLPEAAMNALQKGRYGGHSYGQEKSPVRTVQPMVTSPSPCFMLTNMFDAETENEGENWEDDIKHDVADECRKMGGCVHIFLDRSSAGHIYVKCSNTQSAQECVTSLHGRWFGEKLVQASYVSLDTYHNLFPDSLRATAIL